MILSISNDKKVEILNDHYKDTCSRLDGYRKQRNRLVFYAAFTIGITIFLLTSPSEALPIILSIVFRGAGEAIKNTDGSLSDYSVRLLPGIILMAIAFTYKHYRIAMNKQFTYVQMLESELNSLYPKSNLFNRESNFSSKESFDFAMWNSECYSKILKAGCVLLVIMYVLLYKKYVREENVLEVIAASWGCLTSLISFVYFTTKKPLTPANLMRVLTFGREKRSTHWR